MTKKDHLHLSRRERQIMDIVYQNTEATVAKVLEELPDPPGYSAVRGLLRMLEKKGHLKHRQDGPRYLYFATVPREKARESAIQRLLGTFFEGSVEKAITALLDIESANLSKEELDRLAARIGKEKKRGR
jgi:BlaI family penicillinase repressor